MKLLDDLCKSNGNWSTNKVWHHIGAVVGTVVILKQAYLGLLTYDLFAIYMTALVVPNLMNKLSYIKNNSGGNGSNSNVSQGNYSGYAPTPPTNYNQNINKNIDTPNE